MFRGCCKCAHRVCVEPVWWLTELEGLSDLSWWWPNATFRCRRAAVLRYWLSIMHSDGHCCAALMHDRYCTMRCCFSISQSGWLAVQVVSTALGLATAPMRPDLDQSCR